MPSGRRRLSIDEELERLVPVAMKYMRELVKGELEKEKRDGTRLVAVKYVLGYALGKKGKKESYEQGLEKEQ